MPHKDDSTPSEPARSPASDLTLTPWGALVYVLGSMKLYRRLMRGLITIFVFVLVICLMLLLVLLVRGDDLVALVELIFSRK